MKISPQELCTTFLVRIMVLAPLIVSPPTRLPTSVALSNTAILGTPPTNLKTLLGSEANALGGLASEGLAESYVGVGGDGEVLAVDFQ